MLYKVKASNKWYGARKLALIYHHRKVKHLVPERRHQWARGKQINKGSIQWMWLIKCETIATHTVWKKFVFPPQVLLQKNSRSEKSQICTCLHLGDTYMCRCNVLQTELSACGFTLAGGQSPNCTVWLKCGNISKVKTAHASIVWWLKRNIAGMDPGNVILIGVCSVSHRNFLWW